MGPTMESNTFLLIALVSQTECQQGIDEGYVVSLCVSIPSFMLIRFVKEFLKSK